MKAVYSKKSYHLSDDYGKSLGTLTYPSFFSTNAILHIGDDQWELSATGFSGKTLIKRRGLESGTIKNGWKAYTISLDRGSRIETFRLKQKGFWQSYFVVENDFQKELFRFHSVFRWKTLDWDYSIDPTGSAAPQPELVLLAIHAARSMTSRAIAVTG